MVESKREDRYGRPDFWSEGLCKKEAWYPVHLVAVYHRLVSDALYPRLVSDAAYHRLELDAVYHRSVSGVLYHRLV